MSAKRIWELLAIALAIAISQIAAAQPAGFGKGTLIVHSDRKIVAEPHNLRISEGPLRFNIVRQSGPGGWPAGGLQARLFRLPASGGGEPEPWHRIGDCNIYYSNVFGIRDNSRTVVLTRLEGLSGLTVSNAGITNGRFLVVFEAMGNSHSILRLRDSTRSAYFARGLRVEVVRRPGTQFSVAERNTFLRGAAQHRATYNREVRTIAGRICFQVRTASAASGGEDQYALLNLCLEVPDDRLGDGESLPL